MAAVVGSTEVALSKLALQQAASAEIKTFAQQRVDDHTAANEQLLTLAGKTQMAVPKKLDEKHQAAYDRLSKLQGEAFDRAYARQMVTGHEETARLFRSVSSGGQDAGLKGLAGKLLPKLETHFTMARRLSTEVNGGTDDRNVDDTRAPSGPRR